MQLHFHPSSNNYQPCIPMPQSVIGNWNSNLPIMSIRWKSCIKVSFYQKLGWVDDRLHRRYCRLQLQFPVFPFSAAFWRRCMRTRGVSVYRHRKINYIKKINNILDIFVHFPKLKWVKSFVCLSFLNPILWGIQSSDKSQKHISLCPCWWRSCKWRSLASSLYLVREHGF